MRQKEFHWGRACRNYPEEHSNEASQTLRDEKHRCVLCMKDFSHVPMDELEEYTKTNWVWKPRRKWTPEESRQRQIQYSKDWQARNPERARATRAAYEARLRNGTDEHSIEVRERRRQSALDAYYRNAEEISAKRRAAREAAKGSDDAE